MNTYVIVAGTGAILLFTWFLSLPFGRYHGISRFFAFESIFILLLLNLKYWFIEPFSAMHLLSWGLLIFSIYPAVSGYLPLRRKGEPTVNFENTSVLVRTGI
jgi:hypothetical protein